MVAPDVQIEDGKGTILISSEEGETEGERNSILNFYNLKENQKKCFQSYVWLILPNLGVYSLMVVL